MTNSDKELVCSRAGCSNQASGKVVWRNFKIHAVDREKVWLCCEEHRQYLVEYLEARDFFLRVDAIV